MTSDSNCCFQFGSLDIDLTDSSKLRLLTNWEIRNNVINAFNIVLITSNTVWQGSIKGWMLRERAQLLNLDYEDYCNSLKYAFVTPLGPKNDIVSFQKGVLRWQKILEVDSLILFGAFDLDLVRDSDLLAEIICSLLDSNHTLKEEYDNISDKSAEIQRGWDGLKLQIKEITETKDQMEKKLYAQFVAVLNEKKNKPCVLCRRHDL